jgi:hypothetical protein
VGEGGGVMGDGIFCCLICFEGQRLLSFPEVHISKQRMYVDTTKRNGDIEWETSSAWPGIYYLWMKKTGMYHSGLFKFPNHILKANTTSVPT